MNLLQLYIIHRTFLHITVDNFLQTISLSIRLHLRCKWNVRLEQNDNHPSNHSQNSKLLDLDFVWEVKDAGCYDQHAANYKTNPWKKKFCFPWISSKSNFYKKLISNGPLGTLFTKAPFLQLALKQLQMHIIAYWFNTNPLSTWINPIIIENIY